MAYSRRRRAVAQDLSWPGFVDALSTLLLVIIFLLSIFMLAQFFLGQALSGRDENLRRLHLDISDLKEQLSLKEKDNSDLHQTISELSATLQQANMARDKMTTKINQLEGDLIDSIDSKTGRAAIDTLEKTRIELSAEKTLRQKSRDEIKLLNQQLNAIKQQLASLMIALEASEKKDRNQQVAIKSLSNRLNAALASKVQELNEFRSEFFGKLKKALSNRSDVQIKGDRFIFPSEVLFGSASAVLGTSGKREMAKLAATLKEISKDIPTDIKWVLRVDGHTDILPIRTKEFPSNWDLSTKRALSVVKYLISQGIPAENLAATGFGQYHPLDNRNTPAAYVKNRRIEMRLTPSS
jgi:chemotaxis protein MotB